jgi:hypothetical protein
MATVAGIRSNPAIRSFYLRLRASGKHAKPALTACMRKLLVILNAMLRTKTHWQISALATPTPAISPLVGAVSEHGCCQARSLDTKRMILTRCWKGAFLGWSMSC